MSLVIREDDAARRYLAVETVRAVVHAYMGLWRLSIAVAFVGGLASLTVELPPRLQRTALRAAAEAPGR